MATNNEMPLFSLSKSMSFTKGADKVEEIFPLKDLIFLSGPNKPPTGVKGFSSGVIIKLPRGVEIFEGEFEKIYSKDFSVFRMKTDVFTLKRGQHIYEFEFLGNSIMKISNNRVKEDKKSSLTMMTHIPAIF